MEVVKYRAEHLTKIDLQEGQKYLSVYLPTELRKSLEGEFSFTLLDGEEVLCCAGLQEIWANRGLVWAYLANDISPRRFVVLHKMVKRFLDIAPFDRIETTVDAGFEQGHRWVRTLGFQLEAPTMRKYRPDGGSSALYARVR